MVRWACALLSWTVACSGSDAPGADGGPGNSGARAAEGERLEGRGEVPVYGWMQGPNTVEPHAVVVDGEGNVFVGGELTLSADLGGGVLQGADTDAFLVSYSSRGDHRWSQRFGGVGYDRIMGLDVDASGQVYATGELQRGADLGEGPAASAGVFVASWDNDGALLWTLPLDVVRAHDLAVDPSGVVYVTGEAAGTLDLGGGALTAQGPIDAFVASYGTDRAHRWSVLLGGSSLDYGLDVAAGNEGDTFVTGQFYDVVDFGGGELASAGSTDVFAVSFDPGGSHRWSHAFGGANTEGAGGIAVDARGVATSVGTFDLSAAGDAAATPSAAFLLSHDASGAEHGALQADGAVGHAIAIGAADARYATGLLVGVVDFGGGEIMGPEFASGCWVASYTADGQHRWSVQLPWTGPPAGPVIATGPGGVVYVAGQISVPRRNRDGTLDYRASFLVQLLEDTSVD